MTTTVLLDADQEEIRAVARRYLESEYGPDRVREVMDSEAGFDAERWRAVSELGWPAIALPEEHGGMGYGTVERCLLMEEMGRVVLPAPFLSSAVLAADMLTCAAGPEAQAALLPAIGDGSVRAALVAPQWIERGADAARVRADADGRTLSGAAGLALDADVADVLVVVAATGDGVGLFRVEPGAAGVSARVAPTVDPTRRLADVELERAPAERIDAGAGAAAVEQALDRSTVALAAELAGAAGRCVELTVEYALDRQQFGVPIGSFQAVKHRCADMSIEADAAREAVYFAADVIESGGLDQLPVAAAAAKLAAATAFVEVAGAMIQLHGGIGYTWEHDAHLFYKRALLSAQLLGSPAELRDRLARALDV